MSTQKTTRKPCHGCGRTFAWGRPADEVCPDCKADIAFAKQARERDARTGFKFNLAWVPHEMGYIKHGSRETLDSIRSSLWDLAKAVSVECQQDYDGEIPMLGERSSYVGPITRILPSKEAFDKMHVLLAAIQLATDEAYAEGMKRGRNLLAGLASGDLTVAKFNEMAKEES